MKMVLFFFCFSKERPGIQVGEGITMRRHESSKVQRKERQDPKNGGIWAICLYTTRCIVTNWCGVMGNGYTARLSTCSIHVPVDHACHGLAWSREGPKGAKGGWFLVEPPLLYLPSLPSLPSLSSRGSCRPQYEPAYRLRTCTYLNSYRYMYILFYIPSISIDNCVT